jgi:streptogramin lyase
MARLGPPLIGIALAVLLAGPASAQEFAFEFAGPDKELPERSDGGRSIAIDADGNPWVTDIAGERLVKYTYTGTFVAELREIGGVAIRSPRGLASDDRGHLYLAHGDAEPQVIKFDRGGRLVEVLTLRHPDGLALRADQLAVAPDGRIYASDGVGRVLSYTATGQLLRRTDQPGGWTVRGIVARPDEVVVTASTSDRSAVHRYTPDLEDAGDRREWPETDLREVAVDLEARIVTPDRRAGRVLRGRGDAWTSSGRRASASGR